MSEFSGELSPVARRRAATKPIIAALSVQRAGGAMSNSTPRCSQAARNFSRNRELQLTPPLTAMTLRPVTRAARRVLPTSTSTTASWKEAQRSGRGSVSSFGRR